MHKPHHYCLCLSHLHLKGKPSEISSKLITSMLESLSFVAFSPEKLSGNYSNTSDLTPDLKLFLIFP